MDLTHTLLSQIETPCLVIDVQKARENMTRMQKLADQCHCLLRPHIKTHKMSKFAQMQVNAGAVGITCAKVSEAEIMVTNGLTDVFIAYPMVGDFRIRHAIALVPKTTRLILAVDSIEGALALNKAAMDAGVFVEIRLEIDTGMKRTGVLMEQAPETAKRINEMSHLRLTGIYTYKSLIYQSLPTDNSELAGLEEAKMMSDIANVLRTQGIGISDISVGSTPTGIEAAKTGLVTEIRPGTYIFYDEMSMRRGICTFDEIAVKVYTTVISCPRDDYAVIDGGSKTFPADIPIRTPPENYQGYATIENRDDLRLSRMSEEHGIITSTIGKTNLSVGEIVSLIPIHVCTAINMQNEVYLLDQNRLTRQKVEARGMMI